MTDGRARLVIPGDPVPWARARRNGKHYFTPDEQARHMTTIQQAWLVAGRPAIDGPVAISARFHLARPRTHYGTGANADRVKPSALYRPTTKPDLSNLLKILEDALNDYVWADDAAIVCLAGVHKHYTDLPGRPRWELGEPRTELDVWRASPI